MSFFFNSGHPGVSGKRSQAKRKIVISQQTLGTIQRQGCVACSLNKARLRNPKMQPTGSDKPLVYVLGEAPGETEDKKNEQFVGQSGDVLREAIRGRRMRDVRFNNTIRCHPEDNRKPTELETECCRLSIIADIEKTKPKVILGTGEYPLKWVLGKECFGSITQWRGKPVTVKVGNHICWFIAVSHPSFLLRKRSTDRYTKKPQVSAEQHTFQLDIDRAFELVDLPTRRVITSGYLDNCEWVFGNGPKDFDKLQRWFDKVSALPSTGLDFETQNLRPYSNDSSLLTAAIGNEDFCFSFPLEHPEANWGRFRDKVFVLLENYLTLMDHAKVTQNLKFEMEWIAYYFGESFLRYGTWEDAMSAAYALDERKRVHSLEFLTLQYLGFNLKALSPGLNKKRMSEEPLRKILPYNALDSKWTSALFNCLWDDLEQPENEVLIQTYDYHVDLSATLVFSQMQGMVVDRKAADVIGKDLGGKVAEILKQMRRRREVKECIKKFGEFNPGSPDHNIYILKDVLGLDCKSGDSYSTDENVLKRHLDRQPYAKYLLEWRGLTKLKGTYIDSLDSLTYPDGLLHTNYNHTFTSTGRLSSDDPNNQNWPSRKSKYVRQVITAYKDQYIASFDYGQIDARNIAMASGDEYYVKALWDGMDVHLYWTERLLQEYPQKFDEIAKQHSLVEEKDVVNRFRKDVKNQWTFPLFYGTTEDAAAHHLGVPERVTRKLFPEFWDLFKGVAKWQEGLLKFYDKHGYVETLNGRRRHGPMKREEIYNSVIQGTTAEVVGDAMNRLSYLAYPKIVKGREWFSDPTYHPFMQIHDDLTFRLNCETFEHDQLAIAKVMCDLPFDWVCVPIVVEMVAGPNWYEQPIKKEFRSDFIL